MQFIKNISWNDFEAFQQAFEPYSNNHSYSYDFDIRRLKLEATVLSAKLYYLLELMPKYEPIRWDNAGFEDS